MRKYYLWVFGRALLKAEFWDVGRRMANVTMNNTTSKVNKKQNNFKVKASVIPISYTESHIFFNVLIFPFANRFSSEWLFFGSITCINTRQSNLDTYIEHELKHWYSAAHRKNWELFFITLVSKFNALLISFLLDEHRFFIAAYKM